MTNNVIPIKPDEPKKSHIKRHKKKYSAAAVISIVAAALQLWPTLCPLLPFNLKCVDTTKLSDKLLELTDAGVLN